MGTTARRLIVEIIGDSSNLERSFGRAQRSAKGFDRSLSQTARGAIVGTGAFRSLGRQVAFASSAFLGGAGLVAVLKTSIGTASNLAEQTNKINVVFGQAGRTITEFGKTSATSIGIANDQALEAAGTFGNLFRTVDVAASKNAALSKSLVSLAADLASFNNADPSEVLEALRSGIIGEAEPLRRFGVLLSETRVQQEALKETGKKHTQQLSAQDKVLARVALIFKDANVAQGDFARTADGLANAQRTVSAEIRDTEGAIGKALLPTVQRITLAIRDWLGDTENQKRIQRDVNEAVRTGGEIFDGVRAVVVPLAEAIKSLSDALGGVKNSAKIIATVFVASKILGWASAFNKLATSLFRVAEGEAAVGAAGGGGLFGRAARTGRLAAVIRGGALGAAAGLGATTVGGAAVVGGAVVTAGGATGQHGDRTAKYPRTAALIQKAATGAKLTATEQLALAALGQFSFASAPDSRLQKAENILRGKKLTGTAAGANVSDRQPGRSPAGPAGGQTTGSGGAGGVAHPRASLRFQLSILEEQIAKAERTATQADDRALLKRKAALLQELIGKTKSLQERTALYQELGSVESQIRQIDKEAADKRVAHQQKLLDAAKNQLAKLRATEDQLKQRIKDIQGRFNDAVDTARQGIGELFAGPVLQPTDDARRRTLGLGKPLSSNAAKLTADLKAQTKQFAAFQKDLNTLSKRGAPAELIRELRAQGLAAAPEAHALATAGKGTLSAFLKAFGKRERLAITTARTTMKAQLVTLHADRVRLANLRKEEIVIRNVIILDGKKVAETTTKHQQRAKKGTAAQRGGRNAGVNQ